MQNHTFELMGGLGNQLFQIFAAKNLDANPIFDTSMLRLPFLNHQNSSALSLLTEPTKDSFDKIGGSAWRSRERAYSISHFLTGREIVGNSYRVRASSYDPRVFANLEKSQRRLRVRGYFQSLKYLDFKPQGAGCSRLPSTLPVSESLQIIRSTNWTSLHVRLGDYLDNSWTLDEGYYRAVLDLLKSSQAPRETVLFSDEPDKARRMLSAIPGFEHLCLIEPPKNLSALETIRLMSEATVNVIANSTFSWWGAATNPEARQVIAPEKWPMDLRDPGNLLPSHWDVMASRK